MPEFFFDYGLFLVKAVTVVAAIGAVLVLLIAAASRKEHKPSGLRVEKLNDKYRSISAIPNHWQRIRCGRDVFFEQYDGRHVARA